MSVLEQIKQGRRLARMRMGQDAAEIITLPWNEEVRMAIVPLTEKEYELALSAASAFSPGGDSTDDTFVMEAKDRYVSAHMLYDALREPDDIDKRVFSSVEEVREFLEPPQINYLREEYARISEFSSPALDGLGAEELDELKKAFEKIELSALSGKPWWHLKSFFSSLTPEQLAVSLSGFSSIKNAIGTNESEESIPGASQS